MDFLSDVIEPILWVVFTVGCIAVSGIILLQEGKGGGLGEAFGGAGAQTFGVKAQGVAKLTGYMAGGLVFVAVVIALIRSNQSALDFGATAPAGDEVPATGTPTGEPAAPADPGGAGTEQDG